MSPPRAAPPTFGRYRALAPAKVNLGLFVGPRRDSDGRHQLVSVMQSISLADELVLEPAPDGDELRCENVPGRAENLAWMALTAFREATGWAVPALRLTVHKQIPLAAGLGGGSADAAAALRLAREASGLGDEPLLAALARELGADVPAQVAPGRWLATGAGERLHALPSPRRALGVLVLPHEAGLATGDVYEQADRLGVARPAAELARRERALAAALAGGDPLPEPRELLQNDLQVPALALCPAIATMLERVGETQADAVIVSGSGPTVLGLFDAACDRDGPSRAEEATAAIATPGAIAARSVGGAFGAPAAQP
jgi:4-diphosphocytidyl-2-C-methyl-D-erythritol kinase